jgi:regulatory protein
MKKKYLTYEEALLKMQQFCAYQERCHSELRSKLIESGVYGDTLEHVIADLISENFLNEERFAKAFTGGKFRIKKWGRKKIVQELKAKKISDYSIRKALDSEINEEDYRTTLKEVLNKKAKLLTESDPFKKNQKLAQYAIGRGFESELVWECLNECTENELFK